MNHRFPTKRETTMCSLIIRKTPIVKSAWRHKQHEPGVEWRDCTFYTIRRLDHGRSYFQNVENESRCGRKNSLIMQDDFTNLEFRVIRWKQQKHRKLYRVYEDFFLHQRSWKEFTQTMSEDLFEACQDLQWNHDTSNPHRPETNGVAERADRTVKWNKEQLLHLCKVDCQKNGGIVRWNAVVPCATCMIKLPMARLHSRRDMARKMTHHQFPLEHWSCASQLPRKTSQECISLERERWKEYSQDKCCVRRGCWWGDLMIADYEWKIYSSTSWTTSFEALRPR